MSSTTSDKIRVAGIVDDSITDGPGLRITIFMQGCPHNCAGCHNPSALDVCGGMEYTCEQLMERINKNLLLTGVTFSGGEPILQAAALLPLAKGIKAAGLDLAIYTGYTFEELLARGNGAVLGLLGYADTLIDGPFMLEKRNLALAFRGSANQRIIDLPASLKEGHAVIRRCEYWNAG